jgi:hypothetical protein
MEGEQRGNFPEPFGLFELDDHGIVRYSRPANGSCLADEERPFVGQDFFEAAAFENRNDLKQHFKSFIQGRLGSDRFIFDCRFADEIVRTEVKMARAFRTELFPPECVVMLDIRSTDR